MISKSALREMEPGLRDMGMVYVRWEDGCMMLNRLDLDGKSVGHFPWFIRMRKDCCTSLLWMYSITCP